MNTKHESAFEILLRRLIASFTNNEKDIAIESAEIAGGGGARLSISVHRAEHSKVIGKQGKHIRALEELFKAIGERAEFPIRISLDEPHTGERAAGLTEASTDWNGPEAKALLDNLLLLLTEIYEVREVETASCTTFEIAAQHSITPETKEAIKAIFTAIGKSHSRIVAIDFIN